MHATETQVDVGSSGRWEVITETSLYVLDLDDGRCVRVPDAGLGSVEGLPATQIAALRRDHQATPLVLAAQVTIGRQLILILDVRGDGVATLRQGTIVRRIRRLDGPSGDE